MISETQIAAEVMGFLIERMAKLTEQDPAEISGNSAFVAMGLQSIDAVLLCGELEDHFGVDLDPALIFQFDNVGSFAQEITGRIVRQRS